MLYAIPAHHLAAPRPAPISFEAARAEAARVHEETVADADSAAQTAMCGAPVRVAPCAAAQKDGA